MPLNLTRINFVVNTFINMQDCLPKNSIRQFAKSNSEEFQSNILQIETYLYDLSPDGLSLLLHNKKELNSECSDATNTAIQKLIKLSEELYQYVTIPDKAELHYSTYLIVRETIEKR